MVIYCNGYILQWLYTVLFMLIVKAKEKKEVNFKIVIKCSMCNRAKFYLFS